MHKWHVFQEAQTDQSLTLLVYSYRCTDRRIMVSHETIFKTIFQNRVMKNKSQKLFRDNFCVFKYFLLNPKAREALAPRRSNAPSTVQIRQELAKLS